MMTMRFKPKKTMTTEEKGGDTFSFDADGEEMPEGEEEMGDMDDIFGSSEEAVSEGAEEAVKGPDFEKITLGEATLEQLEEALRQKEAEAKTDTEESGSDSAGL